MKIAISGKGGVGKTTLSSMLISTMALDGRNVIALDADPDSNLASALGVADNDPITPLAEMEEMIKERTGAADAIGGYFQLNPRVDDIPETYARHIGPIRLLTLGGVSKGGGGCICPASALVKALMNHLVLGRDDVVVMDMEAGIEHLGRATAQSMDALVLVIDGGPWSVRTAQRVQSLAADIGLKRLFAVANRVEEDSDLDGIAEALGEIPLIGTIPYDRQLVSAMIHTDNGSITPSEAMARHRPAAEAILSELVLRL